MKIKVSPHHIIDLPEEYDDLIISPRNNDYPIHTILSKQDAYGEPLIQTELVIAGKKTRKKFPATNDYPVHFVKRYSLSAYHSDPSIEYENGLKINKFIEISPPLGADETTFRNCFLPGTGLDKISPFGIEPLYRNVDIAEEQDPTELNKLWKYLSQAYEKITTLHENNFVHGDLELHNIIVTDNPKRTYIIDLESALPRDQVEDWDEACFADLEHILREAIYIQCALGKRNDALAKKAIDSLERLFDDPEEYIDYLN